MSGLLLDFISGVSSYYLGWISSSLFVYLSILTFFAIKILVLDKNHQGYLRQDLFGLAGSFIFCVLLAIIQGVLFGTALYFVTNVTEMGLIRKVFYNAFLPMLLIGFDYLGKRNREENKLKTKEN